LPGAIEPKYFATHCFACTRVEIPYHRQRDLVRRVVLGVERSHVLERHRPQVRVRTIDTVLIRVALREGVFVCQGVDPPVRRIFGLFPLLIDHDGPLPVHLLLCQVLQELREPVGFHPQHALQPARRNGLVEFREVQVGAGVDPRGPHPLGSGCKFTRRLPPLEQQMFEQVC
jgi:hypothetical protein